MAKAKVTASAPVLLVKDLLKAAAYWRINWASPIKRCLANHRISRWSSVTISPVMLALVAPEQTFVSNYHVVEKMWDAYFWVDDVDAIYAEFQASGAIIDYSLYVAPHGVKEFGVQDFDHDIAFGQVIR